MTGLLTADEASRLVPGEQLVIVRAGDLHSASVAGVPGYPLFVAPKAWVALTGPCPTCGGTGRETVRIIGAPCRECGGSGELLDDYGVLTATMSVPCPYCQFDDCQNPDCRDGRRIEPLYTECPKCHPFNGDPADGGRCQTCGIKYHCHRCGHPCNLMATGHGEGKCENHDGRVLVGRGSIEVVPVLHWRDNDEEAPPCLSVGHANGYVYLCRGRFGGLAFTMNPLPRPGNFGIVIDCVEVAGGS